MTRSRWRCVTGSCLIQWFSQVTCILFWTFCLITLLWIISQTFSIGFRYFGDQGHRYYLFPYFNHLPNHSPSKLTISKMRERPAHLHSTRYLNVNAQSLPAPLARQLHNVESIMGSCGQLTQIIWQEVQSACITKRIIFTGTMHKT